MAKRKLPPIAISLASAKGGSSKTTLTANLAVRAAEEGAKVALIDADPQPSLTIWHDKRKRQQDASNPGLVRREGTPIEKVEMLKRAGAEWIFLDLPPGDFDLIEPGIIAADFIIVPVRPSPLDLEAFDPVVELCEAHEKPFCFVLTQYDEGWNLSQTAFNFLEKKQSGHVLKQPFSYRQAYVGAMIGGRTGPEFLGDTRQAAKARTEVTELWDQVKKRVIEAVAV